MYFLGVDIGTSSVKAVLINAAGEIITTTQEHYGINEPEPGYREQDADMVKQATFNVIREIISLTPDSLKIKSICFSAAMHSIMAVDQYGKPLTPLMLWADTRSFDEADDIKYGNDASAIYQRCGTPIHPMLPLTKIKWLKKNEREIFSATYKFISVKEYITYQLIGKYVIDYSIASATGMFDIYELRWNETALWNAGIRQELLSEPVTTTWYTDKWTETTKAELNLPANILLVIGSSDGCMSNVGSGIIPNKDLALTIGTSAAVRITSDKPFPDATESIFNYILSNNLFISGGASNNGGIVLQWLKDFFKDDKLTESNIIEKAFTVEPGCEGLIILPYLLGERAPVWDAHAKSIVHGLQLHHRREHFCRAMIEGIVMNLYSIAEKIIHQQPSIKKIIASGGFVQSAEWLQLVSDVFNLPVCAVEAADASAIGAALWGGISLGMLSEKEIYAVVKTSKLFHPKKENHEIYMDNYSIFKELYANNK
ncbi:MAG: gluconokinase [Sphingobacteriales bacterium]